MAKDRRIKKTNNINAASYEETTQKRKSLLKHTEKIENTINSKPTNFFQRVLTKITTIYIFTILCIYPLYYQNKYYDMGDAKMKFFIISTFLFGVIWLSLWLCNFIILLNVKIFKFLHSGNCLIGIRKHLLCRQENKIVCQQTNLIKIAKMHIHFSITDYFVLVYLVSVVCSVLFSPYQEAVIWGFSGWYMGLVAQVCFVGIYFVVSRCWKWNCVVINASLGSAFIVFLLAVLMRFRIDPLRMYTNLGEGQIINFLSTIGQATWYSSYLVILFPLGLFAYWNNSHRNQYSMNKFLNTVQASYWIKQIFYAAFLVVGFMTMVTQNSDSAFIALGIMHLVLFWFSMESNEQLKRFLQVIIICFSSFKIVGILQKLFPNCAVHLDFISVFCSQSNQMRALLLIIIVVYFGIFIMERCNKLNISKYIFVRNIVLKIIFIGVIVTIFYIILNTNRLLPKDFQSHNHYFLFQENWGNNRGGTWIIAVNIFKKFDFIHKLFGCGPDGFPYAAYNMFGEELIAKWGQGQTLVCAHNEWLNALVNVGFIGAGAYIGIFITAIYRFYKRSASNPILIALLMSVLCYMGHNFFCYQQIICTPIIFIFIGMGEATVRKEIL